MLSKNFTNRTLFESQTYTPFPSPIQSTMASSPKFENVAIEIRPINKTIFSRARDALEEISQIGHFSSRKPIPPFPSPIRSQEANTSNFENVAIEIRSRKIALFSRERDALEKFHKSDTFRVANLYPLPLPYTVNYGEFSKIRKCCNRNKTNKQNNIFPCKRCSRRNFTNRTLFESQTYTPFPLPYTVTRGEYFKLRKCCNRDKIKKDSIIFSRKRCSRKISQIGHFSSRKPIPPSPPLYSQLWRVLQNSKMLQSK